MFATRSVNMRRGAFGAIAIFVTAMVFFSTGSVQIAHGTTEVETVPGEIIVVFKDPSRGHAALAKYLGQRRSASSIDVLGATKLTVPTSEAPAVMKTLEADGEVAFAQPNYVYRLDVPIRNVAAGRIEASMQAGRTSQAAFNDPYYYLQWNLQYVYANTVWDRTLGNSSVRVAVIDSGIDYVHEDRPRNLLLGPDFSSSNYSFPYDDDGHGTHVSGIIAANTNNAIGVSGLAPNVSLLAIKVLNDRGVGTSFGVASGILYAANNGAKVINLSLGSPNIDQYYASALSFAFTRDVVVIASSGNSYLVGNPTLYPASIPGVLAVGAIDINRTRSGYSSTGPNLGIVAPGGSADRRVFSTYSRGQYTSLSGTSMAAPLVSATAALVRSVNPNLNRDSVAQILKETAEDAGPPGRDNEYGWGIVRPDRAVERAMNDGKWQAQYAGQEIPGPLRPGQLGRVRFWVRNSGNQAWSRDGANPVVLATAGPFDRGSGFHTSGSWVSPNRPARLTQASVAPGETGLFEFQVTGWINPGTYRERFELVAEGITAFPEIGLYLDINVLDIPSYRASYVGQTSSGSLKTGQTGQASFSMRNDGAETWYRDSANPVMLAPIEPRDRRSAFHSPTNWPSTTRAARLTQTSVAPGQIGTFQFDFTGNVSPGTYRERFGLVTEGISWFPDNGLFLDFTVVQSERFKASYVGQESPGPLRANQAGRARFYVKNEGTETWYQSSLSGLVLLATVAPRDRASGFQTSSWISQNRVARLTQNSVAPGETGLFEFQVLGFGISGTYRERFELVAEGITWLPELGLFLDFTVIP